jgi:Tol biopolymer transport system component
MPEVEEVFRMATQKVRPDRGALERQNRGQRRRSNRRKAGVYALVAVLMIVGVAIAANVTMSDHTPAHRTPKQTPPLGAEIVGLNGAVVQQISGMPADSYGTDLSPNGREVAFVTIVDGGHAQIATIGIDGSGYKVVTHERYGAEYPRWSPDGTKIAYVSLGTSDNHDIYVMNADGSNRTRLTTSPAYDDAPDWAPNGKTIAYQSGSNTSLDYDSADEEIWTVPATGGAPVRLTHDNRPQLQPSWSPDGRWIAFGDGGNVAVMRADGSRMHILTGSRSGADDYMVRWSPDGTKVAFLVCCARQMGTFPVPDNGVGAREGRYVLKVSVMGVAIDKNGVSAASRPTDLGTTIVTDASGVSWTLSSDALLIYRWS